MNEHDRLIEALLVERYRLTPRHQTARRAPPANDRHDQSPPRTDKPATAPTRPAEEQETTPTSP
jgi:hypothetical protein